MKIMLNIVYMLCFYNLLYVFPVFATTPNQFDLTHTNTRDEHQDKNLDSTSAVLTDEKMAAHVATIQRELTNLELKDIQKKELPGGDGGRIRLPHDLEYKTVSSSPGISQEETTSADISQEEINRWFEETQKSNNDFSSLLENLENTSLSHNTSNQALQDKTLAKQGNPEAQYELGLIHYNQKNYKEACEYFDMAAEQGHRDAWYYLGECYLNGTGVSIDRAFALHCYKKSAEQGHTEGISQLGVLQESNCEQ